MARVRPGAAMPDLDGRQEPKERKLPQVKLSQEDKEGNRTHAASIEIPNLSTSTFRTSRTSRSVWSKHRWLTECQARLKETESMAWSNLLQSLTGEPVKRGRLNHLVKKAANGILRHTKPKREEGKFGRQNSGNSVSFASDPLEQDQLRSAKPKPSKNGEEPKEEENASRASVESVDLLAMAEFKRKMKARLHKRLNSIRQSILKQQNESYAQKKYEQIPQKEREALERAFFHYDADLSGFLEWDEVLPALRELGLSGSNAIEKREILQVCRKLVTASHVQSIHHSSHSGTLQEVLMKQRGRMQAHVKLGVTRRVPGRKADQEDQGKESKEGLEGDDEQEANEGEEGNEGKGKDGVKRASTRSSTKGRISEDGSRKSSLTSDRSSLSEGSESEDFDTGVDAAPLSEASFDFLTFVGILVPKVRQRLTELQSTKVMRYFCNFDRDGTGEVSFFKCIEIARCLRMDQLLMVDALKTLGFADEAEVMVDFDSFERAIMSCREHTNRQVREREIDILVEMKIRPELFEECRDNISQMYEVFRKFAGDAGSIGVVTANDAFLSVYELGMMPRGAWQREYVKCLLVPEDADDAFYINTELNFEEFLEFLRKVRQFNDELRLEELRERFQRLDKDRNGVLDMKELHALLEETKCCPRNRKEQEEVSQLIQSVDVDGNNVIDFEEFKELIQRIDEKFASLRYESEVEYAIARGFTEIELGNFRAIFEHLDTDASGHLDMAEVRQCLSIMQQNSTWQAFEKTWLALDKDSSGTLEFPEFIDFMRLMRDGEGVFAMDAGQKLPSHVKKLDERTLRLVLGHYGLSKSYLWALDKAQLMQRLCESLGVHEGDALQDLKVTTLSDLIRLAKEKGEELANLLM